MDAEADKLWINPWQPKRGPLGPADLWRCWVHVSLALPDRLTAWERNFLASVERICLANRRFKELSKTLTDGPALPASIPA